MRTIGCEKKADEVWLRQLQQTHDLALAVSSAGPWDLWIGKNGEVRCLGQVLTCGLELRDTITVSSTLQGMATLQRQVRTLSGVLRDPQELRLDGLPGTVPQQLTAAAVLLLLDKI